MELGVFGVGLLKRCNFAIVFGVMEKIANFAAKSRNHGRIYQYWQCWIPKGKEQ